MLDLLATIAEWSLFAFGAVMIVIQIGAREAGYAVGRRGAVQEKDEGIGILVGGILGLLAFVLALTLSMATTRNADRRTGTLEEANAIGTAWLQAVAVGGPHGSAIAAQLEAYLDLRREFLSAPRNSPRIGEVTVETGQVQNEIWGHVTALVRSSPTPVTTSLMNAVNHSFDMTTAERFALRYSLPPQFLWLLLGVTVAGMATLGYQLGRSGAPHRWLTLCLSLIWTAVIVETVDLGSGRIGSHRADSFAYDWTKEGFGEIPVPGQP